MIRKLKAFTLAEVLVVVVLTSIVVGLAFLVLNLFTKNLTSIQKGYESNDKFILLEQQLTIDFNRYPVIYFNEQAETLKFKSPIDSTTYKLVAPYIIRQDDTLTNQLGDKELYFLGDKTLKGEIDAIKLILKKDSKESELFVYKPGDAS